MTDSADVIVQAFRAQSHEFEIFMEGVASLFQKHPAIAIGPFPIVHSIKRRTKDFNRLKEKIERKRNEGVKLNLNNCFSQITDFAGVRVLHLKQADFSETKNVIDAKIDSADWYLVEQPIAYTWDPEYEDHFLELGCRCERKESSYTSVHTH
jgi:ppGpp synthetase/RelA/SpoT-type nucleotidyltranferase